MAVLTTGCASLPEPVPRVDNHALADHQATDLGRLAMANAPGPDVSGLRLLSSGEDALGSLAALADMALLSDQALLQRIDLALRAITVTKETP